MKRIHVLNGDAFVPTFNATGIEGEKIICRECLIVGEVDAPTLAEFWKRRAKFIAGEYDADEKKYRLDVVDELEKLLQLAEGDEVFLWFEHDLFCQINLWFVLSLLHSSKTRNISVVFPLRVTKQRITDNFGGISVEEAKRSFRSAKKLSAQDIALAHQLWQVYKNSDLEKLRELSMRKSSFPFLREACQLELERKLNDRPKNALRKIVAEGVTDFDEIFQRFLKTEAAYGFGDSQVKQMLKELD